MGAAEAMQHHKHHGAQAVHPGALGHIQQRRPQQGRHREAIEDLIEQRPVAHPLDAQPQRRAGGAQGRQLRFGGEVPQQRLSRLEHHQLSARRLAPPVHEQAAGGIGWPLLQPLGDEGPGGGTQHGEAWGGGCCDSTAVLAGGESPMAAPASPAPCAGPRDALP